MWSKLSHWLADPKKSLWVQPMVGAVFAIVFSLLASFARLILPKAWTPSIAAETVKSLLEIMSSSMLAVTIFSLSIMVSALGNAASGTTPRARSLLVADGSTRVAINSFILAFIYAVIAKIALGLQYYDAQGRFLLFVSTLLVLLYLIFVLIRWIHTLSHLGSMSDTLTKIEQTAEQSLAKFRQQPDMGATAVIAQHLPCIDVLNKQTGYLSHVHLGELQTLAKKHGGFVRINYRVGEFLPPKSAVLSFYFAADENAAADFADVQALQKALQASFVISKERTFAQDPRFGLLVVTEAGQRSLSASVNDQATSVRVLNALTYLLVDVQPRRGKCCYYDRLSIVPMPLDDFITPVIMPLVRDAKGDVTVALALLQTLALIARHAPEVALQDSASAQVYPSYCRLKADMYHESDKALLTAALIANFPQYRQLIGEERT